MEKNHVKWKLCAGISVSYCMALFLRFYTYMIGIVGETYKDVNLLQIIISLTFESKTILAFILLSTMVSLFVVKGKAVADFLYRHRFFLALAVFAVCVIFEVTGSSVGLWCETFGREDTGIVLGHSRRDRSDEWAVSTSMLVSQYKNYSGKFPYFSDTVRGTSTDIFLEYGQPVYTIAMIFRPFYLGYLFLPLGKGMAFFWCGRLIALFVVSFEFGMLLTKGNKGLSLAAAFLVSFAPAVQWWFAINGLVEMLIFLQLSILMLWKYMNTPDSLRRIPYVAVIVVCAGGYALTMYPAWQISLMYVLLGLGIWTLLENAGHCTMRAADWAIAGAGLLVLAIVLGYVFYQSWDTVQAITNTVFPGDRFETGGGTWDYTVEYTANLWYAMFETPLRTNVCETARFIDFFPVCYFVPALALFWNKGRDKLTWILLAVSVFLGLYCIVGFPGWLAKITFLYNVLAGRCIVAYGFCNVLLLIRSLPLMKKSLPAAISMGVAVLVSIAVNKIAANINQEFYDWRYFTVTVLVWAVLFWGLLQFNNKKISSVWIGCCIAVLFAAGGLVNPVRCGIDSVEEIPELQMTEEIAQADPGALWIVEGNFPLMNMGIMAGAPTVNSTNVYPAMERWKLLDPEGDRQEVYNRYAHIKVKIKAQGKAEFKMDSPDLITVTMTIADAKKLGVKYIITQNDLSQYGCDKVDSQGQFAVYQIEK